MARPLKAHIQKVSLDYQINDDGFAQRKENKKSRGNSCVIYLDDCIASVELEDQGVGRNHMCFWGLS
jgi:hypothetical protein